MFCAFVDYLADYARNEVQCRWPSIRSTLGDGAAKVAEQLSISLGRMIVARFNANFDINVIYERFNGDLDFNLSDSVFDVNNKNYDHGEDPQ